jgi:hypothetical protein
MLNNVSSNYSSFINRTRGFEGIVTSSTMIESSLTLTKTKKVVRVIWYLHSKEVNVFI